MPALDDIRCVVFDIGETLVDESRMWALMADRVGVPRFTVMGMIGALIERGEDHRGVWSLLGVPAPEPIALELGDLYPDARPCLRRLRERGFSVGLAGNQPERIADDLRDAGMDADFIASSSAWGVQKPASEFFERVVRTAKEPPARILYVGDRLDNDVLPARAAGMRTAFIRRGPWGHVHARREDADLADVRIDDLTQLVAILARGADGARSEARD